ncbi:MAG: bifunctional 4-hydroxy-3-methylbut-2-enyl diphosphate reductase/30S ribosomal protein S1 [Clostridia bacterium]|nr:bifunctional 4-hydroxy-3-methylbut-2-enyl diphosphate reductase/30S ribosomal protein S1 [Clostridia bacterium]
MICLAESAGFCFGVRKAMDAVYRLLDEGRQVCTLGPIIHNPQAVAQLQSRGVRIVQSADEVPPGAVLVIRSHGVPRTVYEQIQAKQVEMCDATCPFVDKIHRIVWENSSEDVPVLIAGDAGHPEVTGIKGFCRGPVFVFSAPEELQRWMAENPQWDQKPVIMVSQTTFSVETWKKSAEIAKKHYTNLKLFDTICNATAVRQQQAVALSQKSDILVIVGGRESSNTTKLRDVCAPYCPTLLIETAAELRPEQFRGVRVAGLTAGASTPSDIIKEVFRTMSEIIDNKTEVQESALPVAEEAQEEMSFAEALEASLQNSNTDERVKGIVVGFAPNEVQVEVVGRKQAGYIPIDELAAVPPANPADVVSIGEELELLIMRTNDQEGTMMLSKKRLEAQKGWMKVIDAEQSGEVLEGVVAEVIKGGVLVVTDGVRVFVPASQASVHRMEDLTPLKGQTVRFTIIEVNQRRRRAVGSIRKVSEKERKVREEAFWAQAEVGQKYTGTVKSLTSYGAFVDLGGVDGMVHISELSWERIKHPSEVVKVGDVIEVYIKDLNPEKKKISLGYRKDEENPWEIFKARYPIGSTVQAKIVSLTSFGAFAQILPGIDGLIHISQIADHRVEKPQDELKVGQEVTVKITNVDYDKRRISLSIRALLEPAAPAEETAPAAKEEPAAPAEEPAEKEETVETAE